MKYHVLVGTHYKTGTVWMSLVFQNLATQINVPFINIGRTFNQLYPGQAQSSERLTAIVRSAIAENAGGRCIFLSTHSRFPPLDGVGLDGGATAFRGIHVVRDPRDVLISAARYHSRSNEEWLHIPRQQFNGMSYQQALNQLPTLDEKIEFEIKHRGPELEEMAQFDRQGVFRDVKYEDLIADAQMLLWHRFLCHLGFEGREIAIGIRSFWDRSLFGGQERGGHVSDGRSRQWVEVLNNELKTVVQRKFGRVIEKLGYQPFLPMAAGDIANGNVPIPVGLGSGVNENIS
jgi:hypothetical protein